MKKCYRYETKTGVETQLYSFSELPFDINGELIKNTDKMAEVDDVFYDCEKPP